MKYEQIYVVAKQQFAEGKMAVFGVSWKIEVRTFRRYLQAARVR